MLVRFSVRTNYSPISISDVRETIDNVYHHRVSGCGSLQDTFKKSKSINNDVTLQDVKAYFSKLPQKQLRLSI